MKYDGWSSFDKRSWRWLCWFIVLAYGPIGIVALGAGLYGLGWEGVSVLFIGWFCVGLAKRAWKELRNPETKAKA